MRPIELKPIGLSIVRLDSIENNVLYVRNVDMLDDTPLLDIKPYVPAFDQQSDVRSGWVDVAGKGVAEHLADDRFRQ